MQSSFRRPSCDLAPTLRPSPATIWQPDWTTEQGPRQPPCLLNRAEQRRQRRLRRRRPPARHQKAWRKRWRLSLRPRPQPGLTQCHPARLDLHRLLRRLRHPRLETVLLCHVLVYHRPAAPAYPTTETGGVEHAGRTDVEAAKSDDWHVNLHGRAQPQRQHSQHQHLHQHLHQCRLRRLPATTDCAEPRRSYPRHAGQGSGTTQLGGVKDAEAGGGDATSDDRRQRLRLHRHR